jgi:hypothetical protein
MSFHVIIDVTAYIELLLSGYVCYSGFELHTIGPGWAHVLACLDKSETEF